MKQEDISTRRYGVARILPGVKAEALNAEALKVTIVAIGATDKTGPNRAGDMWPKAEEVVVEATPEVIEALEEGVDLAVREDTEEVRAEDAASDLEQAAEVAADEPVAEEQAPVVDTPAPVKVYKKK